MGWGGACQTCGATNAICSGEDHSCHGTSAIYVLTHNDRRGAEKVGARVREQSQQTMKIEAARVKVGRHDQRACPGIHPPRRKFSTFCVIFAGCSKRTPSRRAAFFCSVLLPCRMLLTAHNLGFYYAPVVSLETIPLTRPLIFKSGVIAFSPHTIRPNKQKDSCT